MDTNESNMAWWEQELAREADEEFWQFAGLCIRWFKGEYPAVYDQPRKDTYTHDEYISLAITTKTLLKAFVVAASTIDEQRADARTSLAVLAANARHDKDPKSRAMASIRLEWEGMQDGARTFRTDAAFARAMIQKYPVIENEGSIKNAVARWRKNASSS